MPSGGVNRGNTPQHHNYSLTFKSGCKTLAKGVFVAITAIIGPAVALCALVYSAVVNYKQLQKVKVDYEQKLKEIMDYEDSEDNGSVNEGRVAEKDKQQMDDEAVGLLGRISVAKQKLGNDAKKWAKCLIPGYLAAKTIQTMRKESLVSHQSTQGDSSLNLRNPKKQQ